MYIKTLLLLSFLVTPLYARQPHMIAEVGNIKCLDRARKPNRLLEEMGMIVAKGEKKEIKLVANIAESVIQLTNEAQAKSLFSGVKVYFKDTLGNSSRGGCLPAHQMIPKQIYMARKCPTGMVIPNKEGIFVHELGHYVANKNGLYPKYRKEVKTRCKISSYMFRTSTGKNHRTINEEFAEVFASYLIYGEGLKRECPASYEFMRDNLFLGSESNCL